MQEQIKQLETALQEAKTENKILREQVNILISNTKFLERKLSKKQILPDGEGRIVIQCYVNEDLLQFSAEVEKIKCLKNLVGTLEYGMTSIAVNGPQLQGIVAIPHVMYAVRMTESEYNSFKFQTSLKP